jgi:DNA-binding transcriptional LysR family regulator
MLSLSLRQIEYACAIGRAGSLSAAAERLHVSQPALSVALAAVEAHLGQPLFLRRPGGPLQPTGFGRAWLAEAETQLSGIARLQAGQVVAPLRLGLFEDFAPILLAPLLARAPEALGRPIQITAHGFDALQRALGSGEIDAALGWALGLAAGEDIARLQPCAILATDHPFAARPALSLADLAGAPLVLSDQDLSIAHVQSLFASRGLALRIAHRCASLDLMRAFAAHGLGIGLSWTQPAPRVSPDGRAFCLCPIHDAPAEAVRLAAPALRAADLAALRGLVAPVLAVL